MVIFVLYIMINIYNSKTALIECFIIHFYPCYGENLLRLTPLLIETALLYKTFAFPRETFCVCVVMRVIWGGWKNYISVILIVNATDLQAKAVSQGNSTLLSENNEMSFFLQSYFSHHHVPFRSPVPFLLSFRYPVVKGKLKNPNETHQSWTHGWLHLFSHHTLLISWSQFTIPDYNFRNTVLMLLRSPF